MTECPNCTARVSDTLRGMHCGDCPYCGGQLAVADGGDTDE